MAVRTRTKRRSDVAQGLRSGIYFVSVLRAPPSSRPSSPILQLIAVSCSSSCTQLSDPLYGTKTHLVPIHPLVLAQFQVHHSPIDGSSRPCGDKSKSPNDTPVQRARARGKEEERGIDTLLSHSCMHATKHKPTSGGCIRSIHALSCSQTTMPTVLPVSDW